MNKKILAICDTEEVYAYHLLEYLNLKKTIPFQIQIFTKIEQLKIYGKKNSIEMLLIAESAYFEGLKKLSINHIMLLKEQGNYKQIDFPYINKYQSCEEILKEVMCYYARENKEEDFSLSRNNNTKIIGTYSPVGRCLQTSFALLLGQLLAKKKNVLYLNFETYSGLNRMMCRDFSTNLTDVMYFLKNMPEKFIYKLGGIVQTVNGMDFIPPAFSYMDLSIIPGEEWRILLHELNKNFSYDFIILDLSDSVQGLFELLRECHRIFTITKEDGVAMAKIDQYEKLLKTLEYEDVLLKSKQCHFPIFSNIPIQVEQLPYSEMAEYVRNLIREEINEDISGN